MKKESTTLNNSHLLDSFDRKIDYLRISVTDRCNLKCVYCMPAGGISYHDKSQILTSQEIVRFVQVAYRSGLRKVRITGGEPLLRKDILHLISEIKRTGIPDLSMTTNGTRLSQMAGQLKEAGLDRINISLDTLNEKKYRSITRGGDLQKVLDGIHEAERAGLYPVKLNMVPVKGLNDDEIVDFAFLTFAKDCHVRFIELMPFGCNSFGAEGLRVDKSEMMERISVLGRFQLMEFKGQGPSRNFRIKGARGLIGFISPATECFCGYCNRLRLTADGKIRPCLFSGVEIDVKNPMRLGITDEDIGHLIRMSVSVKPSGHFLERGKDFPLGINSLAQIGG